MYVIYTLVTIFGVRTYIGSNKEGADSCVYVQARQMKRYLLKDACKRTNREDICDKYVQQTIKHKLSAQRAVSERDEGRNFARRRRETDALCEQGNIRNRGL